MSKTPAQIIDDKGGAASFAEAVGVTASHVRVWKHRNRFPRAFWPEIGRAFRDLDTAALLRAEAASAQRAEASSSDASSGEAAA